MDQFFIEYTVFRKNVATAPRGLWLVHFRGFFVDDSDDGFYMTFLSQNFICFYYYFRKSHLLDVLYNLKRVYLY